MLRAGLTILAALSLLTGCKAATINSTETPAIIPVHSPESLAELRSTIKTALFDSDTLIGTRAFTESSRIVIERRPIIGPNGRMIDTRVDEEPIIFNLVLSGQRCFLVDTRNDRRFELVRANCVPAS